MSRFRQSASLVLVVVLALLSIRLGFWQLSRLADRQAANELEFASRDLPPIDLNAPDAIDSVLAGRLVVASGRFDPDAELILRNRAHNQAPGVHLVTPFTIEPGGGRLWVLRGFAFAPDGMTPPSVTPPTIGRVQISGIGAAYPITTDGGQPIDVKGRRSYRRLDSAVAMQLEPGAMRGFVYLLGDTAGAGQIPAIPPPALDEGPHFSYAIQWFGIATAILAFGWVVILKRLGGRERSRRPLAP
jgi:cytochrome oxidase assembly protein ShyY1